MNRKNGFTLVELLTVIAIMAILAGLLLPALGKAREKANVAKCVATIASLQTALAMYQVDYGVYPPSTDEATQHNGNSATTDTADEFALVNTLAAATTTGGPYMEFKGKDLDEETDTDQPVLLDPWGQAYIYVCQKYFDGSGNLTDVDDTGTEGPFHPTSIPQTKRTYNIYSLGPDKKTEDGTSTEVDYLSVSDWDEPAMYDTGAEECGDWNDSAIDRDNARYDDINSWDGSRSG